MAAPEALESVAKHRERLQWCIHQTTSYKYTVTLSFTMTQQSFVAFISMRQIVLGSFYIQLCYSFHYLGC